MNFDSWRERFKEDIEYKSPQEIKEFQESLLREQLQYLKSNSRYYSRLFESNGIIVALGILDRKNPLVEFIVVLTTARAEGNEIGIRERNFTHSVESFIARISKFGEASLPRSVLT